MVSRGSDPRFSMKPQCSGVFRLVEGEERRVALGRPFLPFTPKLFLSYVIMDTKAAGLGNSLTWHSLYASVSVSDDVKLLSYCNSGIVFDANVAISEVI